VRTIQGHQGYVRGMTFTNDGETLITVGDDKNIRFWPTNSELADNVDPTVAKHSIITKVCVNFVTVPGTLSVINAKFNGLFFSMVSEVLLITRKSPYSLHAETHAYFGKGNGTNLYRSLTGG